MAEGRRYGQNQVYNPTDYSTHVHGGHEMAKEPFCMSGCAKKAWLFK